MKISHAKYVRVFTVAALCALTIFSALCPAVCQAVATRATTTSPHACCPANAPTSQPAAPAHTACHCDHPALALLNDSAAPSPTQDWQELAVAMLAQHRAPPTAHPLQITHAPPCISTDPSSYLRKNTLLI